MSRIQLAKLLATQGYSFLSLQDTINAMETGLQRQEPEVLRQTGMGFSVLAVPCIVILHNPKVALKCADRAITYGMSHHEYVTVLAGHIQKSICRLICAEFEEASREAAEALRMAVSLHDTSGKDAANIMLAEIGLFMGDLGKSGGLFDELSSAIATSGHQGLSHWSMLENAFLKFNLNVEEGFHCLEEADMLIDNESSNKSELGLDACILSDLFQGMVELRRGLLGDPLQKATDELLTGDIKFGSYRIGHGFVALIELILGSMAPRGDPYGQIYRWCSDLQPSLRAFEATIPMNDMVEGSANFRDLDSLAVRLLASFRAYTKVFKCYEPSLLRLEALHLWRKRNMDKASKKWHQAQSVAESHQNTLELGKILLDRYICLKEEELLDETIQVFEQCGAIHFAGQLRQIYDTMRASSLDFDDIPRGITPPRSAVSELSDEDLETSPKTQRDSMLFPMAPTKSVFRLSADDTGFDDDEGSSMAPQSFSNSEYTEQHKFDEGELSSDDE